MIEHAPFLAPISTAGLFTTDGAIVRLPIVDAYPDAFSIVRHLQTLSEEYGRNPDVRFYAALILPVGIGDNDVRAQIRTMTEFVKNSVTYVADPEGTEYVISPLVMLADIWKNGSTIGDCDDHVLLFNSLLRSLGIVTKVIGVKLHAPDRFDHVIAAVFDGDEWIDVDLCAKDVPQPFYTERLVP